MPPKLKISTVVTVLAIVTFTIFLVFRLGGTDAPPPTIDPTGLEFDTKRVIREEDKISIASTEVSQETQSRSGPADTECLTSPLINFPLSPLEMELQRLANLTDEVMSAIGATYWPADATLLGLMRNGRVATDRDLDYSIHATFATCATVLGSLRAEFVKRGAVVKYFKVATAKVVEQGSGGTNGGGRKVKVGRYAMVRILRKFGDFDTGPDFNCIYMDDVRGPSFFTHKNVLTVLPKEIFPLKRCLMYNKSVSCPGDGYGFLATLTPRYDGCMVYPHCLGDPKVSHRDCLTPHPPQELETFVASTKLINKCGFVSLLNHWEREPKCRQTFVPRCDDKRGLCFVQPFKD